MDWIVTPDSSTIARFRYANERKTLEVEFKNGGRYSYFDVPEIVFERMRAASSKGQFLAREVKGRYRYARA